MHSTTFFSNWPPARFLYCLAARCASDADVRRSRLLAGRQRTASRSYVSALWSHSHLRGDFPTTRTSYTAIPTGADSV